MAFTGASSAWRKVRSPACRWSRCRMFLVWAAEARLNTPSIPTGSFRWRYQPGSLTRELAERLASLAEVTDRLPPPVLVPRAEDFAA